MNPKNITTDARRKRLRDLITQVEQLPPSPERDRVLQEIRTRAVDVDTGVPPRAMLPTDPAPSISQPPQVPRETTAAAPKPVAPASARAATETSRNCASSQAAARERSAPILPSPQQSWLLRNDELLPFEDRPAPSRVAARRKPSAQQLGSGTSRSVAAI